MWSNDKIKNNLKFYALNNVLITENNLKLLLIYNCDLLLFGCKIEYQLTSKMV